MSVDKGFEREYPRIPIRIDEANERLIERKATFFDSIQQFLANAGMRFIDADGIILYLSDGRSAIEINFELLKKVRVGENFFAFEFEDQVLKDIVVRSDHISYYEVIPYTFKQ